MARRAHKGGGREGSILTGRAGAVHARSPGIRASEAGEAALRSRSPLSRPLCAGAGSSLGRGSPGRSAPACCSLGPGRCGAALPRAPAGSARLRSRTGSDQERGEGGASVRPTLPRPARGAGPDTPTWLRLSPDTCGMLPKASTCGSGPRQTPGPGDLWKSSAGLWTLRGPIFPGGGRLGQRMGEDLYIFPKEAKDPSIASPNLSLQNGLVNSSSKGPLSPGLCGKGIWKDYVREITVEGAQFTLGSTLTSLPVSYFQKNTAKAYDIYLLGD